MIKLLCRKNYREKGDTEDCLTKGKIYEALETEEKEWIMFQDNFKRTWQIMKSLKGKYANFFKIILDCKTCTERKCNECLKKGKIYHIEVKEGRF